MHKQIIRSKATFLTSQGNLTPQQVWDLEPEGLNDLAVRLDEEHKASGKKSFLVAKSKKDKTIKLKLDFVLDVLNTKLDEAQAAMSAKSDKEHDQEIYALIAEKEKEARKELTVAELKEQLRGK